MWHYICPFCKSVIPMGKARLLPMVCAGCTRLMWPHRQNTPNPWLLTDYDREFLSEMRIGEGETAR